MYDNSGNMVANQPVPLTNTNLPSSLENNGSGTWLTVADYSSVKSTLLRGQDPRENDVPVYTFIAPKANGVVDFYYWNFYPWNQGKNVVVLGEVGDREYAQRWYWPDEDRSGCIRRWRLGKDVSSNDQWWIASLDCTLVANFLILRDPCERRL